MSCSCVYFSTSNLDKPPKVACSNYVYKNHTEFQVDPLRIHPVRWGLAIHYCNSLSANYSYTAELCFSEVIVVPRYVIYKLFVSTIRVLFK